MSRASFLWLTFFSIQLFFTIKMVHVARLEFSEYFPIGFFRIELKVYLKENWDKCVEMCCQVFENSSRGPETFPSKRLLTDEHYTIWLSYIDRFF